MASSDLELGQRLFQDGRLVEAAEACSRHLTARPEDPRALYLLGCVRRAAGDPGGAADAFQRVLALAPNTPAAWFNLGLARRDERRYREAILAFRQATRLDPKDFDAAQNVVSTLAAAVIAGESPFSAAPPAGRPMTGEAVSIVVCSIDDARLARFVERMEPHLAGREHEIVVIRDAKSLCEGYRRGFERSRHPIVAFSHDDFAILSPNPFAAIEAALREADIVGIAGTTRVSGPAVLWSGHPHIHGWVTHPSRDGRGWETAVMSLSSGLIGGTQALDGVFMAMRRDVVARVGFDEATFDGFHFYDLDFTYRAARMGLRLAVTTDVVGLHESSGRFDAAFERYAARFRAKFPELAGPRGANHWYGARFDHLEHVRAFCAALGALAATP